jgi:pilus assembly protein FimV
MIKMTIHNKLKLAILAAITSQSLFAITVDPVQIQSSPGELLYAEIHFRNADPQQSVRASLATPEDLMALGASHQPPGHLNFFTRRDSQGKGVITITSTRPLTAPELNVIVKIQIGDSSRLQHIKQPLYRGTQQTAHALTQKNETPLTPVIIRNEQDIALSLPVSTHYSAAEPMTEKLLNVRHELPVPLKNSPSASFENAPVTVVTAATKPASVTTSNSSSENTHNQTNTQQPSKQSIAVDTHQTTTTAAPAQSLDPLVQQYAASVAKANAASSQAPVAPAQTAKPIETTPAKAASAATKQAGTAHQVQQNESLWKIAARVAQQENRAINDVMSEIKQNNQHAFIQGDVNRLKLGATLTLNTTSNTKPVQKQTSAAAQTAQTQAPSKTKYRLNQAEMSLVAENEQDSNSASANKNTQSLKTSKELSLKVMTAREKTVKLQRNVTDLELALNQKDHRIQLLNARLAELQQQLKAKQADTKPAH